MATYQQFIALQKALSEDPRLIDGAVLYPFDDQQIYAAIMNALARPLPSGQESPFSNQNPGTGHGILMENVAYLQSISAHEMGLMPDAMLLEWMRIWGAQKRLAEYPTILLRFTRDQASYRAGIKAIVPAGTQVASSNDSSLKAITMDDLIIDGPEYSATVRARLNRLGRVETLQYGEFSKLPSLLSSIAAVTSEELLTEGRSPETIGEAVLRMRERLQMGDRVISDRDYERVALEAGAEQVRMIRGTVPHVDGFHRDLRTLVCYPGSVAADVDARLRPMKLADLRLDVYPAEIIPLIGTIEIKVTQELTDGEARRLAVRSLVRDINPPAGVWGDFDIAGAIGNALELAQGIYAVPKIELQHADDFIPVGEFKTHPWQLFQLQQGLTIEVSR